MKTLALTAIAVLLTGTAPALAMNCCGGGKAKAAMCNKGSMTMNTKGKKGGCCCEGMDGSMSKRT